MRKNKEIQDELNELSPELAKVTFTEVYEVPEGYFDEFPVSMLKNLNDSQQDDIPDGYFEQLPGNILSKINDSTKVIPLNRTAFYLRVAIAAVIMGLLGYGAFNFVTNKKSETPPSLVVHDSSKANDAIAINKAIDDQFAELNEDDIISYLEDNGHDVNAALVASLENDNADYTDKASADDEKRIFEELTDGK